MPPLPIEPRAPLPRVTTTIVPRWRPSGEERLAQAGIIPTSRGRAADLQTFTNDQDRGFLGDVGRGLLTGVHRHPFVGVALDHIGVALGAPRETFTALDEALKNETNTHKIARVIGEYGPDLFLAYGATKLGYRAAVAGFRAAFASKAPTGTGWWAKQLSLSHARYLKDATQSQLHKMIAAAGGARTEAGARIMAQQADELLKYVPNPLVERLAQTAGGAVAGGAYFGAEHYAGGHDARSAVQFGLLAGALGAGVDLAAIGLGKALTGRARALVQEELKRANPEAIAALKAEAKDLAITRGPGQVGYSKAPLVELLRRRNKLRLFMRKVEALPATDPNKEHLLKWAQGDLGMVQAEAGHRRSVIDSLEQIAGEPSPKLLTTSEPYWPRRQSTEVARSLVHWGVTPQGIAEKFGELASRVFSQMELAEMRTLVQSTMFRREVEMFRAQTFRALGYSPGSRKAVQNGLIQRMMHEYERPGATPASFAKWLGQPQWVNEAGTTVKLGVDPARAQVIWDSLEEARFRHEVIAQQVHAVGGLPLMTQAELDRFGVRVHWPHLAEPGASDDTVFNNLSRIMGPAEATKRWEAARAARLLPSEIHGQEFRPGPVRDIATRLGEYGTYDYQRLLPGTMWEKMTGRIPHMRPGGVVPPADRTAILPLDPDPFEAIILSGQAGLRRHYMAKLFGYKGELIDKYAEAVGIEARARAEAGGKVGQVKVPGGQALISTGELDQVRATTATFFKNIVDDVVDHRYYPEFQIRLAKTATSINTASKLTLGMLLNLTQWQNTVMFAGWKNLFKGVWQLMRDPELRRELYLALAIPQTMVRGMSGALQYEGAANSFERVAEWLMKYSGFTATEAGERLIAGATGQVLLKDLVTRGGEGRLRGVAADRAHRLLAQLNVDLTKEVAAYRSMGPASYWSYLTNPRLADLEQRVQFGLAQKTQFVPTKMAKPLLWNHPYGRILTQFKTYAMGQARLIKDTVLTEAAHGNVAPLAYFMALAPLTGASVGFVKDAIRPYEDYKPKFDQPILQAIELASVFGGFGLAGDIWPAIYHRNVPAMLLGPSVDTVGKLAAGGLQLLVDQDSDTFTDTFARMPVVYTGYRFFQAGSYGIEMTQDLAREYLDASEEPNKVIVPLSGVWQGQAARKLGPNPGRQAVYATPGQAMGLIQERKGK